MHSRWCWLQCAQRDIFQWLREGVGALGKRLWVQGEEKNLGANVLSAVAMRIHRDLQRQGLGQRLGGTDVHEQAIVQERYVLERRGAERPFSEDGDRAQAGCPYESKRCGR